MCAPVVDGLQGVVERFEVENVVVPMGTSGGAEMVTQTSDGGWHSYTRSLGAVTMTVLRGIVEPQATVALAATFPPPHARNYRTHWF